MIKQQRKKVAIIGAGPSGMIAAWFLAPYYEVTLFDKNSRPGRKLLVAGKGGLNLSHDENLDDFVKKYHPQDFLDTIIRKFDNTTFRQWLSGVGINTYTGSSGKIFPIKGLTVSDCLHAIFNSLTNRGVVFIPNHRLVSITADKSLTFSIPKYKTDYLGKERNSSDILIENENEDVYIQSSEEKQITLKSDYIILALGGASWQITGSDGSWIKMIEDIGIKTLPFQHSNCGINILWNENIKLHHSGKPLKNIECGIAGYEDHKVSGEALITEYGLQGTVIYPLIPVIRRLLSEGKECYLQVDFKPKNNSEALMRKVNENSKSSKYKEIFHLDAAQLSVIKAFVPKAEYQNPFKFCRVLKRIIIPVHSLRPLDECISVVGGIPVDALNEDLSFTNYPFLFAIGEMVDWDAPTGGYLLQACFSMGAFVANSVIGKDS